MDAQGVFQSPVWKLLEQHYPLTHTEIQQLRDLILADGPCDHGTPSGQTCSRCNVWDNAGNETPWGETGSAF